MKGLWGEPDRKYYWEASLTGDLICGYCGTTKPILRVGQIAALDGNLIIKADPYMCVSCKKWVELTDQIIELAQARAKTAFPSGRPKEDGPKWKGDDPYGSQTS